MDFFNDFTMRNTNQMMQEANAINNQRITRILDEIYEQREREKREKEMRENSRRR